jgi:hypothetical protein
MLAEDGSVTIKLRNTEATLNPDANNSGAAFYPCCTWKIDSNQIAKINHN